MAGLSRVTESLLSQQTLQSLQGTLRSIAAEDLKISSGRRYSALSDAPLSTRRLVTWERVIERNEKYESNIELGQSRLGASESALDEMGSIIRRAREIALGQINASATDETRLNASIEIDALVREGLSLANRQFGDRYLFGGSLVDSQPFSRVGAYVSYAGDDHETRVEIAPGMTFEASVSGVRAFGGFSSEVQGRADLNPAVSSETPLAMLNRGRGVQLGRIEILDGNGNAYVDLEDAKTLGDVVDAINGSGFATAVLKADRTGIEISKAGANLTIADVNGLTTASDLGIAKQSMGAVLVGDDVNPNLRTSTNLSELLAGSGVDPTGFTLRNGNLSATIDVTGMETIEDLLNAVNSSGTATVARLSADSSGIEILSHLAGADLFIEEAGGQTARDLGLVIPPSDVPLARLHGGRGLIPVDGDDFRVTLRDGSVLDVDVSDAETLGAVVELINNHPGNGGLLVAEAVEPPTRLRLQDHSGGAGDLSVTVLNGSFVAGGLGIEASSSTGTIEGEDLSPGGVRLESVFDGLGLLYDGLVGSSEVTLRRSLEALQAAETKVLHTRASLGGRIRRLDISLRRTQLETFEFQELKSQEGDTDLAEAIVRFNQHQTTYQAALQTSASLLQQSILDFLV